MGYTTEYYGVFKLSKPLTAAQAAYLKAFSETRRMARRSEVVEAMDDPVRQAVNLPVGDDGEYFVGGTGFYGQDKDRSIIHYNRPPKSQPGIWCHWIPTEDGAGIEWDGGEKFYDAREWLEYLIHNFLERWNIVMDGEAQWQGEDHGDVGLLVVKGNEVFEKRGKVVYDD